jgi:hypothetical protein
MEFHTFESDFSLRPSEPRVNLADLLWVRSGLAFCYVGFGRYCTCIVYAIHPKSILSLEPQVNRTATWILDWPKSTRIEAVGGRIWLLNDTDEPCLIH